MIIRIPKNEDYGTVQIKGRAGKSNITIEAGEGSRATIIEDLPEGNRDETVEITAGQDSEIRFAAVQRKSGEANVKRRAVAQKNAKVEWLDIVTGSSAIKSETTTDLAGEGSQTRMYTVFFGHGKQQFDFLNKCNHIGRNTESLMMTSGALQDSAKAVQQGFAKINEKAYNAIAHQKSKILLLSEDAKASPIPKLEIDNNDVAATHEASVGQIDAEKIFYLMSRGISEKESKKLYVEGFFEQYTSGIGVEELKNDVQAIIRERMK